MPEEILLHKKKCRSVSSFLRKTYEILENSANHEAVSWTNSGVGFVVLNEEKFSKEVLPQYFKHSNYSSFVRQLNMYNFHKLREANFESHFHHEHFRKDDKYKKNEFRSAMSEIRRKPEKKKFKDDQDEDDGNSDISVKKQIKINRAAPNFNEGEIKIKSWVEEEKKGFEDTRHVFGSEKEQRDGSNERVVSIQNILSPEKEEDRLSINNDINELFPRYPTKEIFCPSSNNIYLFPFKGVISNYNIFF